MVSENRRGEATGDELAQEVRPPRRAGDGQISLDCVNDRRTLGRPIPGQLLHVGRHMIRNTQLDCALAQDAGDATRAQLDAVSNRVQRNALIGQMTCQAGQRIGAQRLTVITQLGGNQTEDEPRVRVDHGGVEVHVHRNLGLIELRQVRGQLVELRLDRGYQRRQDVRAQAFSHGMREGGDVHNPSLPARGAQRYVHLHKRRPENEGTRPFSVRSRKE